MKYDFKKINSLVDEAFISAAKIRRQLHMWPELSGCEGETALLIQSELDKLGISYEKDICGHGISAVVFGQSQASGTAIRADIDALPVCERTEVPFKSQNPGVMHACGHDIHTAILLGTAKVLKAISDELPQSVRLLFEPAEETTGGARQMIEAGCLNNPKIHSVIGLHIDPYLKTGMTEFISGSMNAASTEFSVTVKGKSSHGAHPDKGIDPLIPACTMITSLQSIVTRTISPSDGALITVGQFHSGSKNNIIPDETIFSGIIRVLDQDNRSIIKNRLEKMCTEIAKSYGASAQVTFQDSYPALVNNRQLCELSSDICKKFLGSNNVIIGSKPSFGADDFSYFCQYSNALYYSLGCKKSGNHSEYPLHSPYLDPDEGCIRTGIFTQVIITLQIMENMKNAE